MPLQVFLAIWGRCCNYFRVGRIVVLRPAHVAQLVEHVLGKDEVDGSIPFVGS